MMDKTQVHQPLAPGSMIVHEEQHFEVKEFHNLQPYWPLCIPYVGCLCFPCIVTGDYKLVLEEDEAVLHKYNMCMSSVERRPYAQLGEVQHVKCCGCFRGVKTDLNGEGKANVPISPGWGCSEGVVQELVTELQARKVGRGNIAQLRLQELQSAYTKDISAKLDLIMAHLNLKAPPSHVDNLIATRAAVGPGAPVVASPMDR